MDKIQLGSYHETMYKRVCGYINVKVLCDEDYNFIARKFKKAIGKFSETDHSIGDFSWFYYLADFLLLEYYFTKHEEAKKLERKEKSADRDKKKEYLDQLKLKYTYFYCRIVEDHKDYYDKMVERYYKPVYQLTGFIQEENLYYDFITLNRELIMYEFVALNNDRGNMHEKLTFCFKSFVSGWDSRRIIKVLRKKTLNRILIEFINEYSRISGLPQAVLLFYFYPMEEEIYKTGLEKTKLNFYFSRIDMVEFLGSVRNKHPEYVKNIYDRRINNIDKWCTRIRERNIKDMIDRMVNLNSFERR
jgi:hypothetical protein